jgi:N-dimethylarginine dimethylaminohydrolase
MPQPKYPKPIINRSILMSGAQYFDVTSPINAYYKDAVTVDKDRALTDFANIQAGLTRAGFQIIKTDAPKGCQDGIFTANWGLCRQDTVVMSSLPLPRQLEEPHAESILRNLGMRIIKAPYRFSGQGDALPIGNTLFAGSTYRTDTRMHQFLHDELGYDVISLQAVPARDSAGNEVTNKVTGWPDSYFYDLDLGISVLSPELMAWYPAAWTPESQDKIRATPFKKIEVEKDEAMQLNCNLISSGHVVVTGKHGPKLKAAMESHGLSVITVDVQELGKGGGFIRCTTLTLDND